VHSSASVQNVPVESSLNPRGQIHLKLPSVLIQVPGGGQVPVCSTHSSTSVKAKHYSTTSKIAHVGDSGVPMGWGGLGCSNPPPKFRSFDKLQIEWKMFSVPIPAS